LRAYSRRSSEEYNIKTRSSHQTHHYHHRLLYEPSHLRSFDRRRRDIFSAKNDVSFWKTKTKCVHKGGTISIDFIRRFKDLGGD
jgi:hypothetical protein